MHTYRGKYFKLTAVLLLLLLVVCFTSDVQALKITGHFLLRYELLGRLWRFRASKVKNNNNNNNTKNKASSVHSPIIQFSFFASFL